MHQTKNKKKEEAQSDKKKLCIQLCNIGITAQKKFLLFVVGRQKQLKAFFSLFLQSLCSDEMSLGTQAKAGKSDSYSFEKQIKLKRVEDVE